MSIQPPDDRTDPPDGAEAGLFVLGLLDAGEHAAFVSRLSADPDLARDVEAWSTRLAPMHDSIPELAPPPAAWAELRRRMQGGRAEAAPISARRAAEGEWLAFLPGVRMRMIHVEPVSGVRSAIMELRAGAEVPAHEHPEVEECFVVTGTVVIDDVEYQTGDHLVAAAGSRHQSIVARTDVTLMLHWGSAAG